MLVIPAGLPLARQYVRPAFRAADVYRPVTKWSAMAHSVQELPDLMRRAYHAMRSGKGGPVLVEIPNEVSEDEYEGELDYGPVPIQRTAPDPDAVKEAVRMLLAAKNPLLWAGQGVHYAEAGDRLAALAELVPGAGGRPPIRARARSPKAIRWRSAPRRARAEDVHRLHGEAPISCWPSARASPRRRSGPACRPARPSSIRPTTPATSTRSTASITPSSAMPRWCSMR